MAAFYATDAYYTHASDGGALKRATRRWQLSGPLAALRLWAEEHSDLSRYAKRFAPRSFGPFRGSLLDFGCGDGQVADTFAGLGMRAIGVEPDPKAREVAAARGIEVYPRLDDCPPGEFDRIVLRHVLEHIEEPVETLRHLAARLKRDGGRMLISVPNAASHQASVFGDAWIGWDVPRHLWHFSPDTLKKLVDRVGLRVYYCGTVELKQFAVMSAARRQGGGVANSSLPGGGALEASNAGTEVVAVAGHP